MEVVTMKDIVEFGAETYKSQSAFRYKVRKTVVSKTYEDVKRDCESLSSILEYLHMIGKHVAVIGPTSYEWIISYFGIVNSGGVVVPVDAQLPAGEICSLLDRADVSMLIYDELRADAAELAMKTCDKLTKAVSMQVHLPKLLTEHGGPYSAELDPDRLCAILYTSGTTGPSKGVMLTHRNLADNATCLDMKIPAASVSMTLLPIHHAYCFTMDILKALFIGMTICINDSIMHVSKNIKLFKPDIILLVPMVIQSIYAKLQDTGSLLPKKLVAKAAFGGNLRIICSGGAYLDPIYIERFEEYGITILQGYGMTECSPLISTNLEWNKKDASVGKLIPNCEAKVVDEELWVRGSSVMLGYYNMPEETAMTLEDGWLKTGDLGYVDEDGFVFITGRKKNLIILSNGENVSPEELENQLEKYPLVKEVMVSGQDAGIQAEIFPDYDYAKKKHVKDIPETLQKAVDECNSQMPLYKKITGIKVRETEFDKTPSKKIKRNQS